MEHSPSKQIMYVSSSSHEILRILSNHKFIPAVTRARHLSLCCERSPQDLHSLCRFITCYVFTLRICYPLVQNPSWTNTPFRMSVTASPVYSQLPSILRPFTPSAACSSDDALEICVESYADPCYVPLHNYLNRYGPYSIVRI